MHTGHVQKAEHDAPPMPSEAELQAVMERGDRDVAIDATVPLADILAELDEAADRIEVRRRARRA